MRTPPPDVDEARTLPAPVLIAASVQPVLSGTVEQESNHEILDAIDHAHQQLIAAEIAELVGILRAADRWKIDQDAVGAGIERLIQPGHDGTPRIAEFLALEIGALLGISQTSALCRIGDALDLRHRHPKLWQAVLTGKVRVWQATKICLECAHLSRSAAHNVDAAMAASVGMLPWTRIMKALPGQIIAADPDTARQREQARRESRRIRISPIEDGHVSIYGVVNPVDGIKFDHVLNEVAKTFPTEPDTPLCRDLDRRRSLAFGMITQDAYTKLHREKPLPDLSATPGNRLPQRSTPTTHEPIGCTLIVHISADDPALDPSPTSTTGVARIEGWGPLLTEQLPHFLNGANITVRPIIDPVGIRPVDSYETPARMRLALEPHATRTRTTQPRRRLPLRHDPSLQMRQRPHHPLHRRQIQPNPPRQPRTPIPQSPPGQNPRKMETRTTHTRHLPLDLTPPESGCPNRLGASRVCVVCSLLVV